MDAASLRYAHEQMKEYLRAGRLRDAEQVCRQILQSLPNESLALAHLGIIATQAGQHQAAVELLRKAVFNAPWSAEHHYNLSEPLRLLGRADEAIAALREAIRLKPTLAPAYANLGILLAQQGQMPEAIEVLRQAVELSPGDAKAMVNLGHVLRRGERLEEAVEIFQKAIAIAPDLPQAHAMLGSALREAGRIGEAIASFRKAIELQPTFREAHNNLCYALYFDPNTSPAQLLEEHRAWAARFAQPLASQIQAQANDRSPERRLRIGYVSPDLRRHVIGWFMEPILDHHDRRRFEIFCYADGSGADEVSDHLQRAAGNWRATAGLSDEQLAARIRQDQIDVLVDLTLHMRGSRLTMFARKPAPVQITHLAYCGTSGMSAMDGCITDPHMSPPGLNDAFFTERLLRLGKTYWSYRPSATSPGVGPLPVGSRGFVTFGSLNTFAKINEQVIALWKRLLGEIPDSRLTAHAVGGDDNRRARQRFTSFGIAPDRLSLMGRKSRDEYLDLYNSIDIALDPFPYCGGTTSLDALWMGVPLVTLAGTLPVGRTGVTLLNQVGLPELIADSPEKYLQIASQLAQDLPRLTSLRQELRARLSGSPLMNAASYTRDLEEIYRSEWRRWCASSGR